MPMMNGAALFELLADGVGPSIGSAADLQSVLPGGSFRHRIVSFEADGDSGKADGDSTKADGDSTKANGDSGKPNGDSAKADGDSAKADGDSAKADGDSGESTTTNNWHAVVKCNIAHGSQIKQWKDMFSMNTGTRWISYHSKTKRGGFTKRLVCVLHTHNKTYPMHTCCPASIHVAIPPASPLSGGVPLAEEHPNYWALSAATLTIRNTHVHRVHCEEGGRLDTNDDSSLLNVPPVADASFDIDAEARRLHDQLRALQQGTSSSTETSPTKSIKLSTSTVSSPTTTESSPAKSIKLSRPSDEEQSPFESSSSNGVVPFDVAIASPFASSTAPQALPSQANSNLKTEEIACKLEPSSDLKLRVKTELSSQQDYGVGKGNTELR